MSVCVAQDGKELGLLEVVSKLVTSLRSAKLELREYRRSACLSFRLRESFTEWVKSRKNVSEGSAVAYAQKVDDCLREQVPVGRITTEAEAREALDRSPEAARATATDGRKLIPRAL
jgi:hypothetical protein